MSRPHQTVRFAECSPVPRRRGHDPAASAVGHSQPSRAYQVVRWARSSASIGSTVGSRRSGTRRWPPATSVGGNHDYDAADAVTHSPKTSFADIDGNSVKDLQAGMAESEAGMAG